MNPRLPRPSASWTESPVTPATDAGQARDPTEIEQFQLEVTPPRIRSLGPVPALLEAALARNAMPPLCTAAPSGHPPDPPAQLGSSRQPLPCKLNKTTFLSVGWFSPLKNQLLEVFSGETIMMMDGMSGRGNRTAASETGRRHAESGGGGGHLRDGHENAVSPFSCCAGSYCPLLPRFCGGGDTAQGPLSANPVLWLKRVLQWC